MTEFYNVGNSDNFNFKGVPSFLQVCENRPKATQKDEMFAQCWFCYISIAKVWLFDYRYAL